MPTFAFLLAALSVWVVLGHAEAATPSPASQNCLNEMLATGADSLTLEEVRTLCQREAQSTRDQSERALRERLALEKATELNPFVITPHQRNYFMPLSYWSHPLAHDGRPKEDGFRYLESKFQLSIKAPVARLWDDAQLYAAFTGTFFWQTYSGNISRPFRETNYMPEVFVTQPLHWRLGPLKSQLLTYGFAHESNGRDVPLSRSWNRVYLQFVLESSGNYWTLKPWYRLPERKKRSPLARHGDDNPDIEHYLGHFELKLARPFGHQVAEIMVRNNLHSHHNAGAVQLDYTLPLSRRFKGIVQVFTGYGDSLINYNNYETRTSFGILLTDTL